ncbi:MAG: RNA polymerase sigma factor [Isosphaeraceae bacterium]
MTATDPEHYPHRTTVVDIKALLGRIRDGDESAARELLARYESQVRLVVRRQLPRLLRSRFDSIDFLQSVWATFFRRLRAGPERFEDPRFLVGFLARVAKNKIIDQYRLAASRKQDMHREEPLSSAGRLSRELVAHQDSASELAEANEAYDRLNDLLPDDRRELLGLKLTGLSNRDIADRLGLSERTIRRVLEDLRRRAEGGD